MIIMPLFFLPNMFASGGSRCRKCGTPLGGHMDLSPRDFILGGFGFVTLFGVIAVVGYFIAASLHSWVGGMTLVAAVAMRWHQMIAPLWRIW